MEVERTWMHGDQLIFKFKGVDTISDAERLAGAEVAIPMEERAELARRRIFSIRPDRLRSRRRQRPLARASSRFRRDRRQRPCSK